MTGIAAHFNASQKRKVPKRLGEPPWVRRLLIGTGVLFLFVFLILPILIVLCSALNRGMVAYWNAVRDPMTLLSVRLTLLIAAVSVSFNTLFGIAAAWAIAKFKFPCKQLLVTLIDLPFSVSPVISGFIFILLFGAQGVFGTWLEEHNIRIIFAVPGMILATLFVTFPFVVRELIPVMQELGQDEEYAAMTLGATGWQTFFKITLPNIKWGLLYGVILCNARAMGEFGAVSVVSGHIRGLTNTIPLHVEILYNEYNFTAAFAVASLLMLLAVLTLVAKNWIEWQSKREVYPKGLGSDFEVRHEH